MEPQPRDTPGPSELFAAATRNKPQRTYSHKGRNARIPLLPALKPSRDLPPPAHKRVEFQAVRVVTSPVTPPKSSRESGESEGSEGPEADDEEEDGDCEDDDLIILSRHPPSSSLKHDRRTGNGTRSLRRRPFLIFDRTEAKGYKQLNHRPQPDAVPLPSSYRPGDGFSGREAKPNGSNFLTRNGKQSVITGPHVGILDLTQSEPPPAKNKRRFRRANMEDNSFMPPQKKTKHAQRPLGPKDPNQQLKPTAAAPDQEKKTSVAHVKTNNTMKEPTVQETTAENTSEENDQPQDPSPVTNTNQPPQSATNTSPQAHPNTTQQSVSNQDAKFQVPTPHNNKEVDTILIIERSDDAPHEPSGVLGDAGDAGNHDSCETQVLSTLPQWPKTWALSAFPMSPSRRAGGEGKRGFRRVNTQ
ncbi:hypothetical protein C8A05DRAFT_17883 [Staphylotrichum tortipilum]|uniref:Uncharacterized protein n=1 Tax=Staphylotrichum tortipilum TaxID=2831512 RepID=A0AAN6MGX2_9PEZI|nr:hypothetical protein C8A05DRAFT_17883 [Staphylotrichum longicolle]